MVCIYLPNPDPGCGADSVGDATGVLMRNPVRRLQQSFKPEMGYGGHSPWSSGGGDAGMALSSFPRCHSPCGSLNVHL